MATDIRIEGVGQRFPIKGGVVEALKGVDFAVEPHEFVAVVGPSGCGKSTLMRLVAGLLTPTEGTVSIQGRKVERPHPSVGIVFQRPVLLPWKSVFANIEVQIEMRGLERGAYRRSIEELIDLTGLTGFDRALPHELSGGMQQRVSLCRALIHDPTLLLMDEPFGALDAMTREQMNLELQRIWLERRKTVLLITHSIVEAAFLADRVVVMTARPGRVARIVAMGLPRPRDLAVLEAPQFLEAVREIRSLLSTKT